jgi:leader peptidase (prepilin peptidase) / N-methyltransferase
VFLLLVAPFIGSFLGVLITRLPEDRPVLAARSACDTCHHVLSPGDLIPLVSWICLRGRCRYCGALLGSFYPVIELGAFGIALWAAAAVPESDLLLSCVLGWSLLTLAIIDWRTYLLPDPIVLFLFVAGLAGAVFVDGASVDGRLMGAAAGFAAFSALAWVYRILRGREGLGFGDAKLLGALGAWLTWQALPDVVFLAAVLALLFVLCRTLTGTKIGPTDRIPFGTYLALSAWLVWLYGPLTF